MNRKKVNRSFSRSIMLLFALLLFPSIMMAQQISVTGTIVDNETKEPLIGVSIGEKGTTNGTMTDVDGKFTLKVKVGAPLMINYVGYAPVELPAKEVMNIELKSTATALDEVQIVGYGVQKKSVVTAAISSVKGEALAKSTPTRVDNVLRGQVSGVSITQQSGQPGDGSKVLIRGVGTINDSDPLYIVDGMPFKDGIDYLNPSDIESVEVLKDGASAAIYGTRGANGVILVTTKKGKAGKATVNYNFSYGWQRPWRHRKVLNSKQYVELINEVNSGDAFVGVNTTSYDTNWQNEIFNNDAPIVNHQLSLSGGSEKGNYYLSFGYFSQDGIVGGNYNRSNYDRYTVRSNNNYTLFDDKGSRNILNKLQVGVNISYSRVKSVGLTTNSEYGGILGNALMAPPIYPVLASEADRKVYEADSGMINGLKNKDGQYYYIFGSDTNEIVNPLATLSNPGTHKSEDKFISSMWAELDILNNLKFKSSVGTDFNFWGQDHSNGAYYLNNANSSKTSIVNTSMNRDMSWQIENTLAYNTSINKEHNLTVLLGQSAKKDKRKYLYGLAENLFDISLPNIDASLTNDTERRALGQTYPEHNLASYFGRLSYDFDERYMAEFTIRRDGSSNFGPDHKWASFPSVSAGWNVMNEKFMEGKMKWITSFKLRGSWGKNGNESIDGFSYISLVGPQQNYYLGKGDDAGFKPGIAPISYANPNVKWEESEQYDLGFDSRFFNGALSFSFDWFVKKTNGMLMRMTLPSYTGSKSPYANVGDMQNKGVELDVNYRFSVSDFKIRIGANASYIKNKLIKLGTEEGYLSYDAAGMGEISRGQNGLPFPYFFGRKTAGVFQTQAEVDAYVNSKGEKLQPNAVAGDAIFVDVNGDGIIDNNDRTMIGKGMPDWTVGFNLGVEYKGFDLTANLQGTIGNDIYDATRRLQITKLNLPEYTLGRWHGEGTSNKYPRLNKSNLNDNWISSDLYVSNGSFLRLRTLQVGYTLPASLIKKVYLQNLRVFASAENLFTITSYKGSDPEISSGGTSIGIDRGVYPQARTLTVGANITF